MLKATSLRRLPLALLLALTGALLRSAGLALTGRRIEAMEVLWAWGWNVKELPATMTHRHRLQRRRKVDDSALDPLRAPGSQTLRSFVRYCRNYLEVCFPPKSYEPSKFDSGSNMWGG